MTLTQNRRAPIERFSGTVREWRNAAAEPFLTVTKLNCEPRLAAARVSGVARWSASANRDCSGEAGFMRCGSARIHALFERLIG